MEIAIETSQRQHLSQKAIQSAEILQMNSTELEQYIEKMALENPVIEMNDFSSESYSDAASSDIYRKNEWLSSGDTQNKIYYKQDREGAIEENNWHDNNADGEDLCDYLMSQLISPELSAFDQKVYEYIILLLDERGYLCEDTANIAKNLKLSNERISTYIDTIKSLEPAGVGAKDLSECLILQLKRRKTITPTKEKIISEYLTDIAKNHIKKISEALNVSTREITDIIKEIKTLNPKPASHFTNRENLKYITPDVVVVKFEDNFQVIVNDSHFPTFSVSEFYQSMCDSTDDKDAKNYLSQKIRQADWVKKCVAQRKDTLMRVSEAIVTRQLDFFMFGNLSKKPLSLEDLSAMLDLHTSTVSRAMKGKYLQCAWGVYPLNYFLVKSAQTNTGEELTPEHVKAMIADIIESEDKKKPYNDRVIGELLEERGVSISRRTVAKYRDALGIPDKTGRREV